MTSKARNWTLELMFPRLRKELLQVDIKNLKTVYEKSLELLENCHKPFYDLSLEHVSVDDLYFKSKVFLADILSKNAFDDIIRATLLNAYADAPMEIFTKAEKSLKERNMTEDDEKGMAKEEFLERTPHYLEAALEERDSEYVKQWKKDNREQSKGVIEGFLYIYGENRKRRGLPP